MRWKPDVHAIASSLEEWSNESEQRRLWLSDGANGAEVSSFSEALEQLFTDTGLGHELDRHRPAFGEPIDTMFTILAARVAKIDGERPPIEVIMDERMKEVRLLASDLLQRLRNR